MEYIFGDLHMSAVERFKDWCSTSGGTVKVDRVLKITNCEFPYHLEKEDVKEFVKFIEANKHDLRKEGEDVCIMYSEKLIGGYREHESICYISKSNAIGITAHYYSDYGLAGEVKRGLPKTFRRRESVDEHRILFKEEMDVEFNDATDEWMGLGIATTVLKYDVAKRKPDIIVTTLDVAREKAIYRANEALDYVKPAKEVELFYK